MSQIYPQTINKVFIGVDQTMAHWYDVFRYVENKNRLKVLSKIMLEPVKLIGPRPKDLFNNKYYRY
ncbi:hypothetical protein KBC31_01630 [Candidatus Saccharibacteria bacterium]|nr:hypothetical protein [Candidatus Saccharibacteria bacterium]